MQTVIYIFAIFSNLFEFILKQKNKKKHFPTALYTAYIIFIFIRGKIDIRKKV